MVRRKRTIPDDVKASCGPELWDPERARQKTLVQGMNLYFPSLGYRELNPAERAADPNRFREEAMDFLKQVGEDPLHSLGGQGLEVYRLIRVGGRKGAVSARRDAKGEAWAELVHPSPFGPSLRKRPVSAKEWADLEQKAKAAKLAELPLRVGEASDVVDGWILEVWTGGKGKLVECPDPNRDAFRALCEFIERLGAP